VFVLKTEAFTAVLKEGMMIGIKLGAKTPWHGNIIYNIDSTTIRVAYIEKFMKGIAEPGCPVLIKYSNDNFFYYYSGKVINVSGNPAGFITIKVETAEEIINNRLFPRYDVRLEAALKPVWDEEVYYCTVTDLSYSGAAFVCTHSFEFNEQIEMSLKLANNTTVKITGKVVRRKVSKIAAIDHAVQFIECDTVNNRLLSEYFAQLEKEISDIYFNYISENEEKK
jgi:hypothetical protein